MLTKQDIIAFANLDNSKTGEINEYFLQMSLLEIVELLIQHQAENRQN